jgi:hypothetical protein
MNTDGEKSLEQRVERPTLRDLFQDVREQIEKSGMPEQVEIKIQEAIEEVRMRRALESAKGGKGKPAQVVLEEIREILDIPLPLPNQKRKL